MAMDGEMATLILYVQSPGCISWTVLPVIV